MPGRHEAPGSGPFVRQLITFAGGLVGVGLLLALVLMGVDRLAGSSEPVAATTTPAPPTVPETSTSTAPDTTTSVVVTTTLPASTTTTTTTTPQPRPPEELTVLVLNGTDRNQLAAGVTDELAEAGYLMLEPTNADRPYDRSRVWHRSGLASEADVLAEQFPDALVERHPEDDPPADLVVVLGDSYSG